MSTDCLFCKIIAGEIPSHKIYEDDDVYVFLDIGPVSKGHALFIPKEHAQDLSSGSKDAAIRVMGAIYDAAPKMVEALGASGYNLGMNHGADAGQLVFHTHIHLMPRYAGQERSFVKMSPSQEELAATAEQIRSKTMPAG
jgi:histidine triad (HIT) family protein